MSSSHAADCSLAIPQHAAFNRAFVLAVRPDHVSKQLSQPHDSVAIHLLVRLIGFTQCKMLLLLGVTAYQDVVFGRCA